MRSTGSIRFAQYDRDPAADKGTRCNRDTRVAGIVQTWRSEARAAVIFLMTNDWMNGATLKGDEESCLIDSSWRKADVCSDWLSASDVPKC